MRATFHAHLTLHGFIIVIIFNEEYKLWTRSVWPRRLRHELFSSAWTLGSWVRIPLEAWLYVHIYSVSVLSCVGNGFATGWSLVQGVLSTVKKIMKLKKRPGPNKGL
jgi:hypothetical protein